MTMPTKNASSPANASAVYQGGLHRYCCALAVSVLLLIAAGATVTSTGSGLSVPDWPTSYGHNMFTFPPSKWVGGIFYEHTHRLIASAVGLMTIVAAVWMRRREPRRWVRRLAYAALAMVIFQGILGGLTVRYFLPTPISVFHGCMAQVFLCIVTALAIFTSRRWIAGETPPARQSGVPDTARPMNRGGTPLVTRLAYACVAVVFMQLVLGAVMRHTESGLAVPDFPLAYGRLLPALDAAGVAALNETRVWDYQLPAVTRAQIAWHLSHRGGAVLVAVVLVATAVVTRKRHPGLPWLTRPATAMVGLVVVQFALGAFTIWSRRHPALATAHVAVGAATLATCVMLALWCRRLLPARDATIAARPDRVALASPAALAGVRP